MSSSSSNERTVGRCPECGKTAWSRRVGSIQSETVELDERYRCGPCGATFREPVEDTTDAPAGSTHGLARKLEQLAEEHDGDVPIRGGSA